MLFLAASVTALSATSAYAQDDLGTLNDQILANPQDADLNLRYARAAEVRGELRLALAAYERVLINSPDNAEARRGYERIRRALEPPFKVWRLEVGGRWDSNPLNSAGPNEEEAFTAFARATMIKERPFGGRRWRTIGNFHGEHTPDIDRLDYSFLGLQTGPLIYAGPHFALIPSIGGGVSTLDGSLYFNDVNLGLTAEGHKDGSSYWGRARVGWRDYGKDSTAEEGAYAELMAGFSNPGVFAERDTFVFVPWVRWSDIEGSAFNFFFGEVVPGEFVEYGFDANYHYELNDHVVLSAGVLAREREYSGTTIFGNDREDTYVAPNVGVTLQNVLPCECGVRINYQYRDNDSNDPAADFNAQQVSVSLLARF